MIRLTVGSVFKKGRHYKFILLCLTGLNILSDSKLDWTKTWTTVDLNRNGLIILKPETSEWNQGDLTKLKKKKEFKL